MSALPFISIGLLCPSAPLLLFLLFSGLIVYVYFGYPALLWLLTRRRQEASPPGAAELPAVSLIIAAHNEEAVIEQKIRNTLAQTYPRDRLEVIVASDGSDDRTDEIVQGYADRGIRLHRMPVRRGKMPAISSAVAAASGEVFVFSDANAMYEPDALERLVEPFRDVRVGCVCGKLIYTNARRTSISEGESLYWRYENRLKAWESAFNSLIGANGSIYALRRAAYVPLDPDVSDDYGFPLAAYARGYRAAFQPAAVSREEAPETIFTEFRKKSRFVAHQLTTLARLWPALRPWRDPRLLFQLVSHKLLRNSVPFFLLGLLGASAAMPPPLGGYLLSAQGVFYGLALAGMGLYRWNRPVKLFTVPLYFCIVNAAAAAGILQFLRKTNYAAWDEK
jgi:cellulose synthase/poly-beta-1,6-N-acetylglucosamine synthase-like glycosyltransferase